MPQSIRALLSQRREPFANRPSGRPGLLRRGLSELGHQAVEVEWAPREGEPAVPLRPLALVAVPGQLEQLVLVLVAVYLLMEYVFPHFAEYGPFNQNVTINH